MKRQPVILGRAAWAKICAVEGIRVPVKPTVDDIIAAWDSVTDMWIVERIVPMPEDGLQWQVQHVTASSKEALRNYMSYQGALNYATRCDKEARAIVVLRLLSAEAAS